MAEENTNTTMNLDLNLGPNNNHSSDNNEPAPGLYPNVAMNLEEWLDNPVRVREVFHQRNHRWRSLWRHIPISPDTRNLALELIGGLPEAGEGSDSRPTNETKVCESATMEDDFDDSSGKKKDGGKNNTDEGAFFDCNICLDLAMDPVVTCCGHLFCWPCLYRWLHHHSDAKECPVCKGEVTMKNVTPIYGRGGNSSSTGTVAGSAQEPGSDSDLKIPLRPQARRVESWRQAIHRSAAFTIPMEEMIRRLGSTFDLSSELLPSVHSQSPDRGHESVDGGTSLLNRILMARGMRRERSPLAAGPEDIIEPIESYDVRDGAANDNNRNRNNVNIVINGNGRRMAPHFLRRSSSHRAANLAVALPSSGSLVAVEPYFNSADVERNEEVPPAVDDRDSVSSIAAVIHSESQTVDNAIEIDSTVSISTSSSRRRHDVSRISDVDSGDSRAPRRRRLN